MRHWKKITNSWQHMMEGHGFALLTVVCVAVITVTAVWSRRGDSPAANPVPTIALEQQVGALRQQSLREAVSATPSPSAQPILWQAPLEAMTVLREFSAESMVQSGVTGLWSLHAAVDLAAEAGTPVHAMADGCVSACGEDSMTGCWIEVTHRDGYVTCYKGLTLLSALRAGDTLKAGQTLGFVGNGMLDENNLGPHLHLQVLQNGTAVNPISLLTNP